VNVPGLFWRDPMPYPIHESAKGAKFDKRAQQTTGLGRGERRYQAKQDNKGVVQGHLPANGEVAHYFLESKTRQISILNNK